MKIALVHDYLKEFGGAERVLMVLHEMFPEAPIYTAFRTPGSSADRQFQLQFKFKKKVKIITSWADWLIRYKNLHSVLRFLIPAIWESFDFSGYDMVILSSSGYITKPVRIPKGVKVICYCHTPSRFLYGYETQAEWQRYWPVRVYGVLVAHFLRLYDFLGAKRVDQFIANSQNTAARIEKFYRKKAEVIYPPVNVEATKDLIFSKDQILAKRDYFLIVSRIVGMKGIELAMQAAEKLKVPLKVAGAQAGLKFLSEDLRKYNSKYVEFVGEVSEEEKVRLMTGAKAFLAIARDEDFGMTVVEAMAAGTPVVAYRGGGYLETVTEKTGVFFDEYNVESLIKAMKAIKAKKFGKNDLQEQVKKFSKKNFIAKMKEVVGA